MKYKIQLSSFLDTVKETTTRPQSLENPSSTARDSVPDVLYHRLNWLLLNFLARKAEILQATEQMIQAINGGNFDVYAKLCSSDHTCFDPMSMGNLMRGHDFHRFHFSREFASFVDLLLDVENIRDNRTRSQFSILYPWNRNLHIFNLSKIQNFSLLKKFSLSSLQFNHIYFSVHLQTQYKKQIGLLSS